MITLRRAVARRHDLHRRQEGWRTFDPTDRADPLADGFGALLSLSEERLPPRASVPRCRSHHVEVVTYVREGTLVYEDSTGRSSIIPAGEFHRTTVGRGLRHSERNASRTDWAHVFQLWLRPSLPGLNPGHEQRRFSAAERRDGLRVIASPDAQGGSLRIHEDARLYSAILFPGQHVVHELSAGRGGWLHVVEGEATVGGLVVRTGDGVGVTAERALSLTARGETELLLLDVDAPPQAPPRDGGTR